MPVGGILSGSECATYPRAVNRFFCGINVCSCIKLCQMSEFKPVSESEGEQLQDTLKRCPEGTFEALLEYRSSGNLDALSTFLIGCIKRHTDEEYESCLDTGSDSVSFIDDLGIDSMTMMEVVMMVEECLLIQIDNQDLMNLQTIGDLNNYIKKVV